MKSIHIVAETLPSAWEKAVVACWEQGDSFKTEYDHAGDPPSKDCTMMVHITDPMKEPRISRCFPGSLEDLESYRDEVVLGVHDYFMDDLSNPNRWEYTYHQRIFDKDQVERCIALLANCPYTRRAKINIWDIDKDIKEGNDHPPCLQEFWLRIEDGKLNMNCVLRSSDAYKASFMNWFAFIELQQYIAKRLNVSVGSFIFMAHSYHIYGSYWGEFEGFLKTLKNRSFEDRVWDTATAIPMFIEGCDRLLSESNSPEHIKELVRERKLLLSSL